MITLLKRFVRRWIVASDARDPSIGGEIPPVLEPFRVGEAIPLKGAWFTVGKVIGGDHPMMILIPKGLTHGAKLRGLRNMRDIGRAHLKRGAEVRKALAAEVRRA